MVALLLKIPKNWWIAIAIATLLKYYIPKGLEFKVVVVYGYSRDSMHNIVKYYCEKLQRSFSTKFLGCKIYKECIGLGFARNVALHRALSEFILRLDGGTILSRDYISSFVKKTSVRKLPNNVAVLYPRKVLPILKGLKSKIMFYQSYIGVSGGFQEPALRLPYTAMQGTFTLRQALLEVGGFDSKLVTAEDVDIYIEGISPRLCYGEFSTGHFT